MIEWIDVCRRLTRTKVLLTLFFAIYSLSTLAVWNRYDFNPTSMVNFGKEFVQQNAKDVPGNAIVLGGYEGDLGNGYDGQIFYFFSRPISRFSTDWPVGFDESYRAPRIGYPFLIALFGVMGKWSAVFGMYFVNLSLFLLSVFALKRLLQPKNQYLVLFYLLSPFSLGSYMVLVSDSVMVALVILSYYFFQQHKYWLFIPLASLAILTKEPALFFYFPLGIKVLWLRNWRQSLVILSILIIPLAWHTYLKFIFPHWRPNRLTDFIVPLEGIRSYLIEVYYGFGNFQDLKSLARTLSRLPLLLLFMTGIYGLFSGKIQKGIEFRLGLLFTFFMIGVASHYHFWSVYENVSRMFTISLPFFIFLKDRDEDCQVREYFIISLAVLFLFLIKILVIQKTQNYSLWLGI